FAYRARAYLGLLRSYGMAMAISLAVLFCGIVWLTVGVSVRFKGWEPWAGFGGMFLGFGFLLFIAFVAGSRAANYVKNWRRASLVVSPVGLALVQGEIKGEMRWDELRDVQYRSRPRSFTLDARTNIPGVLLKFEGASITIADIYDQPMWIIYQR